MVRLAGALVLNIGTLSPHWVEAMLIAGRGRERGRRSRRPRSRSASARPRSAPTRRSASSTWSTWRCCAATQARWRRSSVSRPRFAASSRSPRATTRPRSPAPRRPRSVSSHRSPAPSTTSRTASRVAAVANGHPLLAARHRHRVACRARSPGCFLAVAEPFDAAVAALVAFGVAGEDAARDAKGPGSFHVGLVRRARRARSASRSTRRRTRHMRVHAIVEELETARRAVAAGATVVQLRVKAPTDVVIERGAGFARARRAVRRQRRRRRGDRARRRRRASRPGGRRRGACARARPAGSAARSSTAEQAAAADADYLGAGPVWATPSKEDADPPIGLEGLRRICVAVDVPVIAIGGIDASNAAACIESGAAGVAVIRAATDPALRRAVDEALGDG